MLYEVITSLGRRLEGRRHLGTVRDIASYRDRLCADFRGHRLCARASGSSLLKMPEPTNTASAQQFMLMTYEVSVECVNLPGSSVTITAEAQNDVFGSSFTWLDPQDQGNSQYFWSSQSSTISGGVNATGLFWDFTDAIV